MPSADPLQVAEELITIFASEDDNELLDKVASNCQEEAKLRMMQEDEVKKAIKGLTENVELQGNKLKEEAGTESEQKLQTLSTEKSVTLQHINQLESDFKNLKDMASEEEKAVSELEQKKEEAKKTSQDIEAKTKYNYSLYTNISRIRWDYNCEEDQIKGFVASLNDVKPFCLDSKQNSKFFTANYLWDLME